MLMCSFVAIRLVGFVVRRIVNRAVGMTGGIVNHITIRLYIIMLIGITKANRAKMEALEKSKCRN